MQFHRSSLPVMCSLAVLQSGRQKDNRRPTLAKTSELVDGQATFWR